MRIILAVLLTLTLIACSQPETTTDAPAPATPAAPQTTPPSPEPPAGPAGFAEILANQPEEVVARYEYRHPYETIEFFGITPGMTVVEVLPGGGWYSKLLLPLLGVDGQLIGTNYATDMWPLFGMLPQEQLTKLQTWAEDWPMQAEQWRHEQDANVSAFVFGDLPRRMQGTADAVLFVRALHNMARFEEDGAYLSQAIKDAYDVLKPGGIVGIVQHKARENMPDAWANGSTGYLKESYVTQLMTTGGFELMGTSDINANNRDQPTTDDIVWRLPPSLQASGDNAEHKAQMMNIGESNRMTLKFRKPI